MSTSPESVVHTLRLSDTGMKRLLGSIREFKIEEVGVNSFYCPLVHLLELAMSENGAINS